LVLILALQPVIFKSARRDWLDGQSNSGAKREFVLLRDRARLASGWSNRVLLISLIFDGFASRFGR
jgi:hypothetical protein